MAMVVAREWREIPGRYNLEGTKCGVCGKLFFPSRGFCPYCRRQSFGKMEPYPLKQTGEVYSFSIVHQSDGFNPRQCPYAVALVKNDDGLMLAGQLVDIELADVKIGLRVRAVLRKLDEDGKAGIIHYAFKFVPDE